MSSEVLMPVITGAGEDGVVTAWFVDDGSWVKEGQLVAEVQAEKIAEEVHAPGDGYMRDRVGINQPVPQGMPICRLLDEVEVEPKVAGTSQQAPSASASPRILASPSAKRVAHELGVDLASVIGSGPGGRITEADVRAASATAAPEAGMTGLRAVIARNMRRSMAETAPVTLTTTVDVTHTAGSPITAWVTRAAAIALGDHPELNGTREGDRFVAADTAHIAVAIQTEHGLVAPVVRAPAESTVDDVAATITELADRAWAGKLAAGDYEGGTFTVTNLGSYGVDAFTPIINLPQVAILGVGALRTQPGFDEAGGVVARTVLTLSLTFDHAFVDGAPAAQFLARLGEVLRTRG